MTHPTPTSGECQAYPAYADRVKEILGELEKVIESKFSIENESLRGYLGTKIDKIDGLCQQLDEEQEENKKLKKALENHKTLIAALDKYVAILNVEIGNLIPIAQVHGWRSGLVEKGIEIRALIDQARKLLEP